MFLRIVHAFNRTVRFNPTTFTRFVSQTLPETIESRSPSAPRPLKASLTPPTALSADVAATMKLTVLKRVPRKKPKCKASNISNTREEQLCNVCALATADWYDLDRLKQRLLTVSSPFQLVPLSDTINDVLCLQTSSSASATKSEAFIFDDGAVVFWNVQQEHKKLILDQVTCRRRRRCSALRDRFVLFRLPKSATIPTRPS